MTRNSLEDRVPQIRTPLRPPIYRQNPGFSVNYEFPFRRLRPDSASRVLNPSNLSHCNAKIFEGTDFLCSNFFEACPFPRRNRGFSNHENSSSSALVAGLRLTGAHLLNLRPCNAKYSEGTDFSCSQVSCPFLRQNAGLAGTG